MPLIDTSKLNYAALGATEAHEIYNGLDATITFEVFEEINSILRAKNDPSAGLIYDFERGMQAPALDMMLRGVRIDQYDRQQTCKKLESEITRLEWILNQYANAIWGKPLNANSPDQLKSFLYGAMGIPPVEQNFKGTRRVTTNREALESLEAYFHAVPIILCIFAIKDAKKLLSVLRSGVDQDGRMRTSYNVAGTETGRWSSSRNAFGTGTNLQNITPFIRRMFVADEGKILCNLDEEQAEARVLGLLVWMFVGDDTYLRSFDSGDLHTNVAKLCWPHLKWTGDPKKDREIAEQPFYRHFSYRDMAKRGGHATNYYGTPRTIARVLKVVEDIITEFQFRYFKAFPGIREYHHWTARELGMHSSLTTPLGRQRTFFGRPGDDATLREGIAYMPQSVVGDILNLALWQIWKNVKEAELLLQVHDSICFQCTEEQLPILIPQIKKLAEIPITIGDKSLTIPVAFKVGWNWADDEIVTPRGKIKNPDGLKKWTGSLNGRTRSSGLDRVIS